MVILMAAAQLGSLLPHVVVPAVMPSHLIPEWGLSYAEAGLMAASYAAGYMLAVPVLSALTDRVDARRIASRNRFLQTLSHFLIHRRHLRRIHAQDVRPALINGTPFGAVVFHNKLEVRHECAVQVILEASGVLARLAQNWSETARAVIRQRLVHFLFRLEIIVEGARSEVGSAYDIAHGRGLITQRRKHVAGSG